MSSPSLVPNALLDAAAARFRLLGDPTRLRLLRALHADGEMTVQDLAAAAEQSHANTSKHLRLLADAGIVSGQRDGAHVRYRISDPTLQALCDLVCDQLGEITPMPETHSTQLL